MEVWRLGNGTAGVVSVYIWMYGGLEVSQVLRRVCDVNVRTYGAMGINGIIAVIDICAFFCWQFMGYILFFLYTYIAFGRCGLVGKLTCRVTGLGLT